MTHEHSSWIAYKQQKTDAFESLGYTVRGASREDHWFRLALFGNERSEEYRVAEVKFFPEPCAFGLDDGRISDLYIRRVQRPSCMDSFDGILERSTELYRYARMVYTNRLADDRIAYQMQRDIRRELG